MPKRYDTAVYIGRFQPFHQGHLHSLLEAAKLADNVVILLGDTGGPRTIKNPWTPEQRQEMIEAALLSEADSAKLVEGGWIHFETILDLPNDQEWIAQVRSAVSPDEGEKICIVGHKKDLSSEYLNWFKGWALEEIPYKELGGHHKLAYDATAVREMFFEHRLHYAKGILPDPVWEYLAADSMDPAFEGLFEEFKFVKKYKDSWKSAPYPVIFSTVDAVVVQSGHVLVVKRKFSPGKGLYALPGGFVNVDERLETAMLRELAEETIIDLQPDTLKRCIVAREVFDDPNRSLRGRTITNAFLIKLNDSAKLPKTHASDDAEWAGWLPIEALDPKLFFDDHFHIIKKMVAKV